jgi:hypothetical protein
VTIKSFYSSRQWVNLRLLLIIQRGPICERCGKLISNPLDLIAHHKHELTIANVNDASISLNPDNIELICLDCHNIQHKRFSVVEHSIYIVYGAPLSVKSSYVKQNMQRGDLVIDMDLIFKALSMQSVYDKPNNLLSNVFAVRNLLIDNIKTRYGKWFDCYIIGGYPIKFEREKLASELNAELIFCDATKEECISRLYNDSDRLLYREQWSSYINKWFEQYTV